MNDVELDDIEMDLHPIQYAMRDCIRTQLKTDKAGRKKFILNSLSDKQLRDVIIFVDSFDQHNLDD